MEKGKTAYGRLLRNRNFMALWIGQTISFVGDYFYWLAIPIIVERLTGSALLVGLSVISSALPMLVLGPIAGVFVDRWDRKRTMILSDVLRALLVLACLLVKSPDQIWVFYVIGFLMSCVSRFFFPAQNAVLPLVVEDKDDLLAANGLMQIVQTAGFLIGPAMAGFTIGMWGEQIAFLVDSGTYFASAVAVSTMVVPRTTEGRQPEGDQFKAVWRELHEGVAYLFGNRTMVGILLCLSVVQLGIGAIHVVWVPFLQRTFGLGAEGLGAVDTAQGVGMVLGGLMLGFATARFTKKALASWGLVLIGIILALIGKAPPFSMANAIPALQVDAPLSDLTMWERLLHMPLALIAYGIIFGVALVPVQSALMTMMQLSVPDLKRGRVGSALNALTMAAGLLSMAAAAAAGEVIELSTIYVVAGLITAAAGLLGLVVLQEPEPQDAEQDFDDTSKLAEAAAE
jgi:MFS family permease